MTQIINFFLLLIPLLFSTLSPLSAAIGEEEFQQRKSAVATRVDTIIKEWLSKEETTHPWMTEEDFDAFSLKAMIRHIKPYLGPTTLEKFEGWLRSTFNLDQWGASTLEAYPFTKGKFSVFTGMEHITIFKYRPEYPKRLFGSKVQADDPSLHLRVVSPKTTDPKEINIRIEELLDMALNTHITTREIKWVNMHLEYDRAHLESGLMGNVLFFKIVKHRPPLLKY